VDGRCMTQTELVERWRINEATLKRWRTESNGPMPVFLKFGNQVRYRTQDVEDFEEVALGGGDHDRWGRRADNAGLKIFTPTPAVCHSAFASDHDLTRSRAINHTPIWSHAKKPSC